MPDDAPTCCSQKSAWRTELPATRRSSRAARSSVMKHLADEGMTMVLVTHEMSFARRVGDWVAVFDVGCVIEQGPPKQIFEVPLTERTRDFLSHLGWAG